ncbi:transcriptional regulator [Stenotrophomonas acidaminiphila]|uniref:transcriptional regulator n=1 Tax=Stenotrophomonas acidaminiphila TaxID=128780 RepID=UPI0015FD55B4|nr:transcriptional regulator [Stenotrophomonas acidaminiphila]
MRPLDALELEQAGKLLFGERWQSELARAIGVTDRLVRMWVAGKSPPRPAVRGKIVELLRARQEEITAVLRALEAD